ncbi:MAG TPA: serine hydrolase [Acidobacteriota bacterium]|nr:serine hydrolase [Acidobacteriota bacterium]
MKKLFLAFLFFVFLQTFLFSSTEEIDAFVNGYIQKKKIPGVAALVKKDGTTVLSKGYGYANLEHMVPVKPETIFQSGSIGKQFTATAVMILVEEGKVQLSDPVSKYLTVPKTWDKIKISHMLSHTSGLGDYPEEFDLQKDYTEDDLLKMVTASKLFFEPGEQYKYSNLAYLTLGILIHKVTGKFYGDFLQERVFQPLGMDNTRIISEADIIPNRAAGYRLVKDEIKNQEWVAPSLNTTADGSLYFNVLDMAKWDAGLETEKILKKSSLDQMWTEVVLNNGKKESYGFGWGVEKTKNGHRLIEHGGAWQGFTSHIARYVDDGISVMVLCNLAGGDSTYIAHKLAGFYNADLGPAQHTATSLDPSILKSYEGTYRLDDRLDLKVTLQNGKLISEFGSQRNELIPESETLFFVEDSEYTYEFKKDSSGKVTGFLLRVPTELEFKRIEK